MIGVAIFLLLYVGLWDDPEAAIGIAWGSFVENLIALIALVLIGFGIRFAFYSKPCPVCDEKLRPTATDCHQCGFNFETAPHWISRGSHQSYLLPKAKNFCAKSLQLIVYLFQLSVGCSMIIFVNASILFGDVGRAYDRAEERRSSKNKLIQCRCPRSSLVQKRTKLDNAMWPTHDGPKILVVDDYDNLRKLVATFLSRHGYTVLEAADGGTAIQIAIAETPKFILLDIFLPDMNGMEVARQLRQVSHFKHIPIVGWCGTPIPREQALLRASLTDCVLKPLAPRALRALVERFVPKLQQ